MFGEGGVGFRVCRSRRVFLGLGFMGFRIRAAPLRLRGIG